MRKRDLYLKDWHEPEGEIHGATFIRHIQEDDPYRNGIRLMDELIDKLLDENIEAIVLVDGDHRYTSTIEDWQEYGKAGPTYAGLEAEHSTYLPFSYMEK